MKTSLGSFFKGFQFRLLAYMLVIGSVTLFLSFYFFYSQTANLAEKSNVTSVRSAHMLMLEQLRSKMDDMDQLARRLASDDQLRSQVLEADNLSLENRGSPDDRVSELMAERKPDARYTICLVTANYESDSCGLLIDSRGERLQGSAEKKLYLLTLPPDHWQKNIGIALHYPIPDPATGTITMEINVIWNMTPVFQEFKAAYASIIRQVMIDEQGISYSPDPRGTEPAKSGVNDLSFYPYLTGDRIIDELPISLEGYSSDWTYRIEMKSEYATAAGSMLRTTALVLLTILILLSVVSSVVFSRFFTKPIVHLRSLFKRAEAGDLKAYWTGPGAKEIDDLGESYNQMLFRIDELFRQVKLEESLKKEKEIEALQYQLNPHFLYNTLNTIKWVAKIHKTPQISEVVSSLVRLLQASLGKKGDFITIREEVKLIQDYMEIQAFRYGEQVRMVYDIDPVASLCLVPRMIMQPLVENALIHGIEPKGKDGVITIKAWLDRDLLLCQVEDNGVGIPESELETASANALHSKSVKEKLSGIGLNHIRQKIKLYYGPDYKMHVFSGKQEGTTIRLSLPIHRGEEVWET